MCFYDHYKFSCGDWKWGNFRQHCQREYRMGETCGIKLVEQTLLLAERCQWCEKIDRKNRKIVKLQADAYRWQREDPRGRKASIAKALEDIESIKEEVEELDIQKNARSTNFAGRRR